MPKPCTIKEEPNSDRIEVESGDPLARSAPQALHPECRPRTCTRAREPEETSLAHLSQAFRSLVIARRCHSALYGCWVHNFLPEVSPGSLARVQVLGRHSGCRAWGALRARGSPLSHSILSKFGSSLMVQGLGIRG